MESRANSDIYSGAIVQMDALPTIEEDGEGEGEGEGEREGEGEGEGEGREERGRRWRSMGLTVMRLEMVEVMEESGKEMKKRKREMTKEMTGAGREGVPVQ